MKCVVSVLKEGMEILVGIENVMEGILIVCLRIVMVGSSKFVILLVILFRFKIVLLIEIFFGRVYWDIVNWDLGIVILKKGFEEFFGLEYFVNILISGNFILGSVGMLSINGEVFSFL